MLTNVNAKFEYFNSAITSCYQGSVVISSSNIALTSTNEGGACLNLGLSKTACANTYGCYILSSRASQTLAIGDTITFGCGIRASCDATPGYNCCTQNDCNCSYAFLLIVNVFNVIAVTIMGIYFSL